MKTKIELFRVKKTKNLLLIIISGIFLLMVFYSRIWHKDTIYCKNCNIVLISLDTLRAKSLPCYGYSKNTSPNLCNFADRSLIFNNAYSQSAYTLDSHFSIFTSLYPSSHNMLVPFKSMLSNDIVTATQVLKKYGYRTLYAGSTGSSHLPLDRGLGRGFDSIEASTDPEAWIESLKKFGVKNGKFFAFLHTYKVHDPYTPSVSSINRFYDGTGTAYISEEDLCAKTYDKLITTNPELYGEGATLGDNNNYCDRLYNYKGRGMPGVNVANDLIYQTKSDIYKSEVEQDSGYLKMLYEAEIYDLDSQIKSFMDYLDKEELLKDTIVIFTSDHGEEFMEHGLLGHVTQLYSEDIKIPLIIYAPKLESKRVDNIVQSIDIFPTVFAMLGITDPDFKEQMQGTDILKNTNEYVFCEYSGSEKQMVTDGIHKLIKNNVGGGMKTYEFYDLTSDPDEKTNIWDNSENLYTPFINQLNKHNLDSKKYYQPTNDFPESINDEQRKELIEKGYF